jgi:Mg/Co/Ni transporter MgtE
MPDAPAQTSSAILSKVARLFGKYNPVAAPVVGTANRLVGVITIDDVVDAIEEEADEGLKALGGSGIDGSCA